MEQIISSISLSKNVWIISSLGVSSLHWMEHFFSNTIFETSVRRISYVDKGVFGLCRTIIFHIVLGNAY